MRNWSFTRRPFWLFTHVFVTTWLVCCVVAMVWQIGRMTERRERVEVVEAKALGEPTDLLEAMDLPPVDADFVRVQGEVEWTDGEVVRIGPRSQGGVAGEWVVGAADMSDGRVVFVLRGFVPQPDDVANFAVPEPPAGPVDVVGWLRQTETQEFLGRADDGGDLAPRMDVSALGARIESSGDVAPMWLQLEASDPPSTVEPVGAPTLDEGPHFSYAVQWALFALLTVAFYGAMLWRKSAEREADG